MMNCSLRIRMFGSLDLNTERGPLSPFLTQKTSSLFAYLALHPAEQGHSREFLADLLWPSRPSYNARRSLHTALWEIRRRLREAGLDPDAWLVVGPANKRVAWRPGPGLVIDVVEFEAGCAAEAVEALRASLGLYRGPFLEGIYDDWVVEVRNALEEKYIHAQARIMRALELADAYQASLEAARQLLKTDPVNEDGHRAAIRALYHLGDRARAVQQYEICAKTLRSELGIDPSAETVNLYHAILLEELPLPALVRELVVERIERLPEKARELVQLAALAGPRVPLAVLRQTCSYPDLEEFQACLALLETQQLVRSKGEALEFTERYIAENVLAALSPNRRRALVQRLRLAQHRAGERVLKT